MVMWIAQNNKLAKNYSCLVLDCIIFLQYISFANYWLHSGLIKVMLKLIVIPRTHIN